MRIKSIVLLCLLLPIGIYGQHRSEDRAIEVAREFFSKDLGRMASTLSVVKTEQLRQGSVRKVKTSDILKSCYIVNDETNNRFAFVGADERLPKILGYSDYGTFESQSVSDYLFGLLAYYDQQYEWLQAYEGTFKAKEVTTTKISPMVTALWHQQAPFNNNCPMQNSDTCVTGCVATAMAQMMHYYKFPDHGYGSISYTSDSYSINHFFENDVFDWENMLDDYYNVNATEAEMDAVGKLMYSCGVSVATKYGLGNSTANRNNIPFALIHYFGYNPNLVAYNRNFFSADEWYDIIDSELEAGRPLLYGAFNEDDNGHRVIVDGRDENGLYHVNWGIRHTATRTLNGYYSLDILRAAAWENGEIVKESDKPYSYKHTMVCRISPQVIGSREDVFYAKIFSIASQEIEIGQRSSFQISSIYCNSTRSSESGERHYFNTEIGVGLFDRSFNFVKSLNSTNRTFTCQDNVALSAYAGDFTFSGSTFKEGEQYYIAPYVLVEGESIPTRIRTWMGTKNHYLAEVKDNVVKLTLMGTMSEPFPNEDILGDVNGDMVVDRNDAICIVNYVLKRSSPSFNAAAADVNADGVVNITDALAVMNIVLNKN